MLINVRTPDGETKAIVTGQLIADPRYSESASGKHVCNFSVRYERKKKGEEGYGKTVNATAWDKYADLCATLEKGDNIVVFGELLIDDYWTRRNKAETYKVNAELAILPDLQFVTLQMMQQQDNAHGGDLDGFTDETLPPDFPDFTPSM